MVIELHRTVRADSQKAKIWKIADALYNQRGEIPSGPEVVEIFARDGGNERTAWTQFSHWKKAVGKQVEFSRDLADDDARDIDAIPLSIEPDGTLSIPARLRAAMMLDPDGRVTARVQDGELRIIAPKAALAQLQKIISERDTGCGSPSAELIAERRAEAQAETE